MAVYVFQNSFMQVNFLNSFDSVKFTEASKFNNKIRQRNMCHV